MLSLDWHYAEVEHNWETLDLYELIFHTLRLLWPPPFSSSFLIFGNYLYGFYSRDPYLIGIFVMDVEKEEEEEEKEERNAQFESLSLVSPLSLKYLKSNFRATFVCQNKIAPLFNYRYNVRLERLGGHLKIWSRNTSYLHWPIGP